MNRNTTLYLKEQPFPLMFCLSKEINYQYNMNCGGGGNKPWSSLLPRFISSFGKLTSKHMTERVSARQVTSLLEIIGAVVQGVPPPSPHWRCSAVITLDQRWYSINGRMDGTKSLQQSLSQFQVSGAVCGMKKVKWTWIHDTILQSIGPAEMVRTSPFGGLLGTCDWQEVLWETRSVAGKRNVKNTQDTAAHCR